MDTNIELKCQSVQSLYGVWPRTASMEVKNKYVYVITQDICNRLIEAFFVGSMVSWPNRLWQCLTTMSLINKIGLGRAPVNLLHFTKKVNKMVADELI